MLGAFATGKTSLVRRFVHSRFSEKYHTTVGVKIDRKELLSGGRQLNLLLWDLAGEDDFQMVRPSYLRGASGLVLVVDGTRRSTLDRVASLSELATGVVGEVPTLVALNKTDMKDEWELPDSALTDLASAGWTVLRTSAKTGERVDEAFRSLADAMMRDT